MTEVPPSSQFTRVALVEPQTGMLTVAGREFLEQLLNRTGGPGNHNVLKVRGGITSVDRSVVRFDGTTADAFTTSSVIIDDTDNLTVPGTASAADVVASGDVSAVNVNPTGTVDGRDVAADGAKLDTIESAAEVNAIGVFETVVGQAALASGGTVTLLDAVTGEQWKVREIFLSGAGTNFNGGGDRLLDIKEGTTIYSTIPAATLQTLAAARWGDTGVPFPATPADLTTATTLSADIVAQYSGGTTDYTAGSLTIILTAERVTP